MRPIFVKTRNADAFIQAYVALEQRGAREACIMVIDGEPGLGKTNTAQWWAIQNGAIFLRSKTAWSPSWMLRELLEGLRKTPEHSFQRMFRQAMQALGERAAEAQREDRPFALVVDEVDHIVRSRQLLETLRDLTDFVEIPLLLVGMGKVRHHLSRFPQVASRVGQFVEFQPAPFEDTQRLVAELCEVPVQPELVDFLHRASGGRFREVKEGIAAIERFGRMNLNKPVGMAEMAGKLLLNDRRSGHPILVKA